MPVDGVFVVVTVLLNSRNFLMSPIFSVDGGSLVSLGFDTKTGVEEESLEPKLGSVEIFKH